MKKHLNPLAECPDMKTHTAKARQEVSNNNNNNFERKGNERRGDWDFGMGIIAISDRTKDSKTSSAKSIAQFFFFFFWKLLYRKRKRKRKKKSALSAIIQKTENGLSVGPKGGMDRWIYRNQRWTRTRIEIVGGWGGY